jgi:hypothetical protein
VATGPAVSITLNRIQAPSTPVVLFGRLMLEGAARRSGGLDLALWGGERGAAADFRIPSTRARDEAAIVRSVQAILDAQKETP